MTILQVLNQLLGQPITTEMQVSATAVAGFTQAACDITPLMFCMPEDDPTTGTDESELEVGDMMRLRTGGPRRPIADGASSRMPHEASGRGSRSPPTPTSSRRARGREPA